MKEEINKNHASGAHELEAACLYAKLMSGTPEIKFEIHDLGEGMALAEQVLGGYWKPRYLINHNTKCAHEFMDESRRLCTITVSDIVWESLKGVPQNIIERAHRLSGLFPTHICNYENGVAQVCWQLNPDGMYYRDDDGYGMTDDEKVELYGFIDKNGKTVVRFEHLDEDMKRLKTMKNEAEKKYVY